MTGETWDFNRLDLVDDKPVKTVKRSDIDSCPHLIMVPEHYNDDGTCRCGDQTHQEMADWGYTWSDVDRRWQ
jgi:hypothetical protein